MFLLKRKKIPTQGSNADFRIPISLSHYCTTTPNRLYSEKFIISTYQGQRAKKAVSDSPWLVDFAIVLVNSVLNLPVGQVKYFEELNLEKTCEINSAHQKFGGLVEMTFGPVNASFSLP